ncbi:helix-turn-helix domain-containing protein [Bacillus mycoides]|uniref:helix-turn-helix domain-containing protein n=1 Tax=Bacillus mycoides TaxID=1405 RepID=UPI001C015143|nr:helix-turn-helix transcriptional regulator [Bacillus mycoides]MED1380960.1 helix-turn-helix transcriptional regulator [Bacillus mycoides]QWH76089.1 XRE family transcriptional regulator [Bacillus mycoides]QWI47101.1 XRE family transcriptional regulator [Bacillus mycoides]
MKEIIGTNLKTLRILHNLTQKKIADDLNIPVSTYTNWEKGSREPNIFNLKKMSLYYSVNMDDLLTVDSHFPKDIVYSKNQESDLFLNLSDELTRHTLKENLKSLRVFKEKTRKEIAMDLSVAPSGYTNWEYGYRQPDFTTLKKIAHYHGIDIETLISHQLTEYDLLKKTGESKEDLISRFSKDLYQRYLRIPDEFKPEVKKKLLQHVKNPSEYSQNKK